MSDTPAKPALPEGFNPGEDPISRPDLWAIFVCVCEGEAVTAFSFAKSVNPGHIAAFRSAPIFVEVGSPSDVPPAGALWDGQSFTAPPVTPEP